MNGIIYYSQWNIVVRHLDCFGILPAQEVRFQQSKKTVWTLMRVTLCCSKTLTLNYHSLARKITIEGTFHLHCGESLKSINDVVCLLLRWWTLQTSHTTLIMSDKKWQQIHILRWFPERKITGPILHCNTNTLVTSKSSSYILVSSMWSNILHK